jgi:hypothetical protein
LAASITIKCVNGATRFNLPVSAPSVFPVKGCWVEPAYGAPLVQCFLDFAGGGNWTEGFQAANNDHTFTYNFQNVPIPPQGASATLRATLVAQQGGPVEAIDGPLAMNLNAAAPQIACPAPACP